MTKKMNIYLLLFISLELVIVARVCGNVGPHTAMTSRYKYAAPRGPDPAWSSTRQIIDNQSLPLLAGRWTGPPATSQHFLEDEESVQRIRRKAAESSLLWPDAIIPFKIMKPKPDRSSVLEGIVHWETHTCIRFVSAKNLSAPMITFRKLTGCRSGVGLEQPYGQNISIGINCNKIGIVVHEIGHALGFYHEIRRPDRDEFVVINVKNILEEELYNFYKLHWLDVNVKYDLSSVMQYHALEWSSNGRTTVATTDPMMQGLIGSRKRNLGLSHRDKLLANTIYGCLDTWLSKCKLKSSPCNNEGYLGVDCKCVCAPGTTGQYCQYVIAGYYDELLSPCNLEVTYETTITSPNYPSHYDKGSWCVYRLKAEQCFTPRVTINDFSFGGRDKQELCNDYLEIRNDSLYEGEIKCGNEVSRGTTWTASGTTMIIFFKGESGNHRGFKARVTFPTMPGCCRTYSNKTGYFWHTPEYPNPYKYSYNCSHGIEYDYPSRVIVSVIKVGGHRNEDPWPCALRLCQPNGKCNRYCRGFRNSNVYPGRILKEIVLPNAGSIHQLKYQMHKNNKAWYWEDPKNVAYQISFTLEDSACHKILYVNKSQPNGEIIVGPKFFEQLQCEWWIQATEGDHVKLSLIDLYLSKFDDNYIAINENGDPSYPNNSTRVYGQVILILNLK